MKPITLWYKEVKKYEYNHFEEGHSEGTHPKVKFETQNGWLKDVWKKEYGFLDENGRVIKKTKDG